jgi:aminoglycoside phosphotransferase (APT) family kinase protein
VEREYNILKGIAQYNATLQDAAQKVPVPKVYILCKDNKVIQSDFYIMEFLQVRSSAGVWTAR